MLIALKPLNQIGIIPYGVWYYQAIKILEEMMARVEKNIDVSQEALLKRLRRIEGQVRGIEKMIVDERDCVSIVIQLAAVRSGIEGIGALVLKNCMKLCFRKGPDAAVDIDSLGKAMAVWGRVRGGDDK